MERGQLGRCHPALHYRPDGGLAGMAACSLAPVLAEVALSAFAAPPWNETRGHARKLVSLMLADAQQPGFTLALAFISGGARLAGFGYGLSRCPIPGSAADSLPFAGTEPFEFCQLAVRPAARGIGAGRALHDAVLAASGPQPRRLVTHPAASPPGGPPVPDQRLAYQPGVPQRHQRQWPAAHDPAPVTGQLYRLARTESRAERVRSRCDYLQ
jgi:GNAT superfamily N-acetyltransferase